VGAAFNRDRLLQGVPAEHARGRRGDDQLHAVAVGHALADPEWWLGIRIGQNRTPVAKRERQLEACLAADVGERTAVGSSGQRSKSSSR
jgi:hypothetical protein